MTTFRLFTTIAALSVATMATATPAGPKPVKAPKVSVQAPKGNTAKAPKVTAAPKGSTAKATSPKSAKTTTTAKSSTSGKSTAKKGTATTASTSTTSTTTESTTPTTPTTPTEPTTPTTPTEPTSPTTPTTPTTPTEPAPPNAISTKISSKPDQLARIQSMLPAGMTLEAATAGFRNQGQFIAALNASKNQGVNFVDLQKAMTVDGLSLGQAVKKVQATPPAPTPPGGVQ